MSDNPYQSPNEGANESDVIQAVSREDSPEWVQRQPSFLGHPPALFVLFFAEMWERFSYYGMRALLVFYMIKGFLSLEDGEAYSVYGAYTALVYMTPFFGGMIADRFLGARISVVIGGVLMAAGHLLMTVEKTTPFYFALALLIVGNGFFKPNISTMVGSLYPAGSPKRDGGFTIFYIGINLGAAMSPLLCGYIGETYGWHWGFGLATIGMMIGLAVFVMPTLISQVLILKGALLAAIGLFFFHSDNLIATLINVAVGISLLGGAALSVMALAKGGLPNEAGRPHHGRSVSFNLIVVLALTVVAIPIFALLVSGFSIVFADPVEVISEETIDGLLGDGGGLTAIAKIFLSEISKPAGLVLSLAGLSAFGFLIVQTFLLERIARERMFVVLILTFFSMLFWSFFEQAGSSLNNFTDRNVDRVVETEVIEAVDVGTTLEIQPTQEQLGHFNGDKIFTLTDLDGLRATAEDPEFTIAWEVVESNVGMGIATRNQEIAASIFQSVNPGCILVFGLIFTAMWTLLGKLKLEPNTAVKFSLGLIQLGLGFGMFWYGASVADDRGMVAVIWLILGYMFQTTGELCLSPVGLSMVTKLSPKVLVSTVMGGWFMATAFSQYLAAIISQLTGVGEGGEFEGVPIPAETVDVYGGVFGQIAIAAIVSGVFCLILSPLLSYWMHSEEYDEVDKGPA